MGRAPSAVTL